MNFLNDLLLGSDDLDDAVSDLEVIESEYSQSTSFIPSMTEMPDAPDPPEGFINMLTEEIIMEIERVTLSIFKVGCVSTKIVLCETMKRVGMLYGFGVSKLIRQKIEMDDAVSDYE